MEICDLLLNSVYFYLLIKIIKERIMIDIIKKKFVNY